MSLYRSGKGGAAETHFRCRSLCEERTEPKPHEVIVLAPGYTQHAIVASRAWFLGLPLDVAARCCQYPPVLSWMHAGRLLLHVVSPGFLSGLGYGNCDGYLELV